MFFQIRNAISGLRCCHLHTSLDALEKIMTAPWKRNTVFRIIYHLTDPVLKGLIIVANEHAGHIRAEHIANHWGRISECLSVNVYQDLALTEASAQMALDRLNWNLNRTGVGGWLLDWGLAQRKNRLSKTPRSKVMVTCRKGPVMRVM